MRILTLIFVTIVLAGCQSPQQKISKIWLYTHYSGNVEQAGFSPTSFLLLKPDGSYTKDFGHFESGKWNLEKDKLVLYKNKQQAESYKAVTDGKILQLTQDNKELVNFESAPIKMESDNENPFSLNNNKWRLMATSKENDEQLKARLINHCKFWEVYFTWALNNNLSTIDVRSTASPIKIYGNGFTIKPVSDLPKAWVNIFNSNEDCTRANQIMENVVKKNSIAWAQTDNKYKMFIGAFQQLQRHLKNAEL
jgi:hypothetical protein